LSIVPVSEAAREYKTAHVFLISVVVYGTPISSGSTVIKSRIRIFIRGPSILRSLHGYLACIDISGLARIPSCLTGVLEASTAHSARLSGLSGITTESGLSALPAPVHVLVVSVLFL
jgi:hypothetical protein